MYAKCSLCPRNCGINRNEYVGFCGQKSDVMVARASLHYWEEPCISGENGSGTVFFSGCNLKCVFCQNKELSLSKAGKKITLSRLCEIYFELQNKKAHNINLVTPSHFAPYITKSIVMSKEKGLKIPFVYNTGGYEKTETIKMFNKLIDIYLPDLKYIDSKLSQKYSFCNDYFKYASDSIDEMVKQVGTPVFDECGMLKKGVIIRHLVLPDNIEDSKNIIKYIYNSYGNDVYISIMNQFTPIGLSKYPEINRKLLVAEYDEVVDYALSLGVKNAYIQEGNTASESFIPEFDCYGV